MIEKLELVSVGTFSSVYRAKDVDGTIVALKKYKTNCENHEIDSCRLREISILKNLNHPNIVNIIDIDPNYKYIVMEYIAVDLDYYIKNTKYEIEDIIIIASQLLDGIEYIHSCGFIHRDLKPHNILVDYDKSRVVIADFGLARRYSSNTPATPQMVTIWYRAPEILLGYDKYSCAVDMWSFGCIIYEVATKKVLFQGNSDVDQLFKILETFGNPSPNSEYRNYPSWTYIPEFCGNVEKDFNIENQDLRDFLLKILKVEFTERMGCIKAKQHNIFSKPRTLKRKLSKSKPCFDLRLLLLSNSDDEDDFDNCLNCFKMNLDQQKNGIQNYYPEQDDLNENMRTILLDWLIEVKCEYGLTHYSYFRAQNIIDSFLIKYKINRSNLQLLGVAALSLASKSYDVFLTSSEEYAWITDDTYTESDLVEFENLILSVLDFQIYEPLLYDYYFNDNTRLLMLLYVVTFDLDLMTKYHPKDIVNNVKEILKGGEHTEISRQITSTQFKNILSQYTAIERLFPQIYTEYMSDEIINVEIEKLIK